MTQRQDIHSDVHTRKPKLIWGDIIPRTRAS